jgi:hypothetical protein
MFFFTSDCVVLFLDVSVLQQSALSLAGCVWSPAAHSLCSPKTCLFYISLCCQWMCLVYSSLYYPWTCLLFTNSLNCPKRFWPTKACASPERVFSTSVCAVTVSGKQQPLLSTCRHVCLHYRLNMELDLQNLFGLLCTAVLIG